MEREYTDYDEWMRNGGDPTYGQGVSQPQNPFIPPPVQPPQVQTGAPPPPTGGTRNPNAGPPGSNTPNMDPPGYRGGYWGDDGNWVQGSPSSNGPGFTPGNPYEFGDGGDGGDFDPGAYQWTPFNPTPYGGYGEFQANPFLAPDPESTANDPWLQFALKQGTNQVENSAAYQGMVRSGMNKKNVLEHGVNFTRQFGNDVWNRALQGWQANEDNRFRTWGGNRQNSLDTYNTNYRGQSDSFNATRDAEKTDFNARLQQWRDRLNATTQVATAGLGG